MGDPNDPEIDIISRKSIADDCRALSQERDVFIVPEKIQEKLRQLPDHGHGIKRVAVVVTDGTIHHDLYISWAKEILVREQETLPFDINHIVDVQNDSLRDKE